jgi:hypothetical protein
VKKYSIAINTDVGPEDGKAGRVWDVVYAQNWSNGAYLPALAKNCTQTDAKRIANCLEACEGTLPENVQGGFNKLIEDHALLKLKYNNLLHDVREGLEDLQACLRA